MRRCSGHPRGTASASSNFCDRKRRSSLPWVKRSRIKSESSCISLPTCQQNGPARARFAIGVYCPLLSGRRHGNALSHPLGAPHADTAGLETEAARTMGFLILYFVDADRIFECHTVRAGEIEEARARGRMPAGSEHDRHVTSAKEIKRPQHIVVAGHLMIDMLDTRLGTRRHRKRVMNCGNPHQRNISNPVADAGVAHLRPELFVANRVSREKADVAETGDTDIAGWKEFPAAPRRTYDELDRIAGRVFEPDKRLHHPRGAFRRRAAMDGVAKRLERRSGGLKVLLAINLETNRLFFGISLGIAQGVRPIVGAKIETLLAAITDFQAKAACRKALRHLQIRRAEPYVADLFEFDHVSLLSKTCQVTGTLNSGTSAHSLPQAHSDSAFDENCRGRSPALGSRMPWTYENRQSSGPWKRMNT